MKRNGNLLASVLILGIQLSLLQHCIYWLLFIHRGPLWGERESEVTQLGLTLCDPMNCSLPLWGEGCSKFYNKLLLHFVKCFTETIERIIFWLSF